MIHLNENNTMFCPAEDLPDKVVAHSAVNSQVGPIICGGSTRTETSRNCHRLINSNGSWERFHPLNIGRRSFSMTEINDLLVSIGGSDPRVNHLHHQATSSLEYINVLNGTKWIKRDMPFSIYSHCSMKINQSTILITGGWNPNGRVSKDNQILCYQIMFTHELIFFI